MVKLGCWIPVRDGNDGLAMVGGESVTWGEIRQFPRFEPDIRRESTFLGPSTVYSFVVDGRSTLICRSDTP